MNLMIGIILAVMALLLLLLMNPTNQTFAQSSTPAQEPPTIWRDWALSDDFKLLDDRRMPVGVWNLVFMPITRDRHSDVNYLTITTAETDLVLTYHTPPPQRGMYSVTVSAVEVGTPVWFPLNGTAMLVFDGDKPVRVGVKLAERQSIDN